MTKSTTNITIRTLKDNSNDVSDDYVILILETDCLNLEDIDDFEEKKIESTFFL